MGFKVITASGTAHAGACLLTSLIYAPITSTSAGCTVFDTNLSAAASAVKVMHMSSTSASNSLAWSDPKGVNMVSGIYVVVSSAYTSVFWD